MEVQEALSQIAEIHRHIARTECYRGYRPVTMAITASVAVVGGLLQPYYLQDRAPIEFARFWLVLAAFNLVLVSGEICVHYVLRLSRQEQRLAWRSVAQFMPCLAAGAVCTLALGRSPETVGLLPGIWTILFSLGIFASRPYLPHGVGWVGLFYLLAGTGLLALAPWGLSVAPWGMGGTFGIGQLLMAVVLNMNLERPEP